MAKEGMLHTEIKKCLERFEQDPNGLASYKGEYYLSSEINEILSKQENYEPTKEDKAETMAFGFLADYPNDNTGWGTYYGPILVSSDDKGETMEDPSIKDIDRKILEYWTQRARESQSPFLSSRYADLVVDFSQKKLKNNPAIDLVHKVIDSNIAICENSLTECLACQEKIKRALELSIKINDPERINNVKSVILKFVTGDQSIDDSPGLWVFPFKCLLLDYPQKISISDEERKKLVKELEERLARIKENPWHTEDAVSLLSEHYASQKDEQNLIRVLEILEQSFKTNEYFNSNALLKYNSYKRIHEIYHKYASRSPEAKKASERLFHEISELDLNWEDSMQEVSVEAEIKKKKLKII